MKNQPPGNDQKAIALQLSQDLNKLRDAMTRLSFAMKDYVFEYTCKSDQTTSLEARSVIDQARLKAPPVS